MSRCTFIRHAESTANIEGWMAGTSDVPLTPLGCLQARGLADPLQDLPTGRVWCSPLQRAQQTAQLALPGAALHIDPDLAERSLGEWEGVPRATLRADGRFRKLLEPDFRPPGGESHLDLMGRAHAVLSRLETAGEVVVFSHGGLLRALLGILDRSTLEEALLTPLPNAAIQTRWVGPSQGRP